MSWISYLTWLTTTVLRLRIKSCLLLIIPCLCKGKQMPLLPMEASFRKDSCGQEAPHQCSLHLSQLIFNFSETKAQATLTSNGYFFRYCQSLHSLAQGLCTSKQGHTLMRWSSLSVMVATLIKMGFLLSTASNFILTWNPWAGRWKIRL